MSAEQSDEELLVKGGAQGFGLLYQRRYPLVRGYLRRRVGPRPDLVLDLVAETFARALERREQFDPQRGSAISWLLGIAHHVLVDAARRGRVADESRRRLGMERVLVEDAQLELIERTSESDLQRALAELPIEQRQAIEGRVLEEQPYAAIATQIGRSEQVVRKRVSRGLAALRRSIKESA
ncbi:MAG TPA: RNA polymerase sigma factor [Solirubrobacteraceae bacterium]|jgi:RNA polymerase sigma factor (sigma-70 family)|nr:RNA polymerase sigma factor [Solirubrobacteraceae bacterium]